MNYSTATSGECSFVNQKRPELEANCSFSSSAKSDGDKCARPPVHQHDEVLRHRDVSTV
jgi:hypothetical protein